MEYTWPDSAFELLSGLRGFAFDLDGTIWEGSRLLPGAIELITDLRSAGLNVVFASNCSRSGSTLLAQRLADLGINSTADEVLTPFDLVGGEIKRRMGPIPVLVIGTEGLSDVLLSSGHTPIQIGEWAEAKAVVVGVDLDFNYDKLRAAARAVASGAAFFAVNLDRQFPVGLGLFDPGCGALAAAIAIAGNAQPVVIGKPELTLFRVAIERLNCLSRQTAMVGDSESSDIAGGRAAGMFTIWLDPQNNSEKPSAADLNVRDLRELHQLWQEARNGTARSLEQA
jgi:HAD superfamily hydrolase (TIGR01450 family)